MTDFVEKHLSTNKLRLAAYNLNLHTELLSLIEHELDELNKIIKCDKTNEAWVAYSINTLLAVLLISKLGPFNGYSADYKKGILERIQTNKNFCFRFIDHKKLYGLTAFNETWTCVERRRTLMDLFFYRNKVNSVIPISDCKDMINKLLVFTVLLSARGRVGVNSKLKILSGLQLRCLFDFL